MKNGTNLFLALSILAFAGLGCGDGVSVDQKGVSLTNAVTLTSPSPAAAPAVAAGSVTLASFNQIKTGMKYDVVVKILGREGEVLSETEMGNVKTVMYKWDGDASLSNMNAMFQNGKLISKSQFGLK